MVMQLVKLNPHNMTQHHQKNFLVCLASNSFSSCFAGFESRKPVRPTGLTSKKKMAIEYWCVQ